MSRYKNLFTGNTIMTEQNALRHYIKKLEKAVKNNLEYNTVYKIYNETFDHIQTDLCHKCPYYDIGYCYFRYENNLAHEEKFMKYCLPNFIKSMKWQLKDMQKGRK